MFAADFNNQGGAGSYRLLGKIDLTDSIKNGVCMAQKTTDITPSVYIQRDSGYDFRMYHSDTGLVELINLHPAFSTIGWQSFGYSSIVTASTIEGLTNCLLPNSGNINSLVGSLDNLNQYEFMVTKNGLLYYVSGIDTNCIVRTRLIPKIQFAYGQFMLTFDEIAKTSTVHYANSLYDSDDIVYKPYIVYNNVLESYAYVSNGKVILYMYADSMKVYKEFDFIKPKMATANGDFALSSSGYTLYTKDPQGMIDPLEAPLSAEIELLDGNVNLRIKNPQISFNESIPYSTYQYSTSPDMRKLSKLGNEAIRFLSQKNDSLEFLIDSSYSEAITRLMSKTGGFPIQLVNTDVSCTFDGKFSTIMCPFFNQISQATIRLSQIDTELTVFIPQSFGCKGVPPKESQVPQTSKDLAPSTIENAPIDISTAVAMDNPSTTTNNPMNLVSTVCYAKISGQMMQLSTIGSSAMATETITEQKSNGNGMDWIGMMLFFVVV